MKAIESLGVLVLTAICAAAAAGAQGAAAGTAPGQAAGGIAPAGPAKPDPALERLEVFAGTWSCAGTAGAQGNSHPVTALAAAVSELGGFSFEVPYQERKTKANPAPAADVGHWAYSDELKKLIYIGVDNGGGFFVLTSSGLQEGTLAWVGDFHTTRGTLPFRATFVRKSRHSITFVSQLEIDGNWITVQDLACHRARKR